MAKEQLLVPPDTVNASMGEISSCVEAPGPGTLVLRWSNYACWVRAKLVFDYTITVE